MIVGNRTVAFARAVLLCAGVLLPPAIWDGQAQARAANAAAFADDDAPRSPGVGARAPSLLASARADALVARPTAEPLAPPPAPDPTVPPPEAEVPVGPPEPPPAWQAPPSTTALPAVAPLVPSSSSAYAPGEGAPGDFGPRRPRFEMSMGMGISRDGSGLVGQRTVSIPAFQAQIGVGASFLGLELRLFSNQAAGRYHQKASPADTPTGTVAAADTAVDRLALDLMIDLRPLTFRLASIPGWLPRVARSLTINLGFAAESDSVGPPSTRRYGPVVGGHMDLPLTRATDATDLRVRLSARRLYAGDAHAGTVQVSDTKAEFFGGLALVF